MDQQPTLRKPQCRPIASIHRIASIQKIASIRKAAASERTGAADTLLGMALTFVAGAINAGGFLAVGQYTSHMSGILSTMADNLALGALGTVLLCPSAFLPFVAGGPLSAHL